MIGYKVADGIATVTLDRPDRLNALTLEMAQAFVDALDQADRDPAVRAVIVTGAGRAFCAGADLAAGSPAEAESASGVVQRDFGGLITLRLFDMNTPVIAAINGPAVGVGATMTLAMDVRISVPEARFGFVFVRRGLVPEAASSWFLPRIVGLPTALRWCLSGAMVGAQDARDAGLVQALYAPNMLMTAAQDVAREFIKGPAPVSVALTRRMLWSMTGAAHPMEAHILDSRALAARAASPDLAEGIASFLERRDALFPDRPGGDMSTLFADWAPRPFS